MAGDSVQAVSSAQVAAKRKLFEKAEQLPRGRQFDADLPFFLRGRFGNGPRPFLLGLFVSLRLSLLKPS